MDISVIFTTARLGGIDMLMNSMQEQSFPKNAFEVIVVDEWYQEREEVFGGRIEAYAEIPIDENSTWPRVYHYPPDRRQDFYDPCHGLNTGLRRATGELVVFLADYFWVYPNFLSDHWDIYKNVPGYSMTGHYWRFPWPRLKDGPATPDNLWWSAFPLQFDAAAATFYFNLVPIDYKELKGGYQGEPVPGTPYRRMAGDKFYASGNESIPMSVLKKLNGWDERYDGGYASCDIDLGVRAEMVGWKFLLNPTVTFKIGQQSVPCPVPTKTKKRLREPSDNFRMYQERMERIRRGEPIAVPQEFGAWK